MSGEDQLSIGGEEVESRQVKVQSTGAGPDPAFALGALKARPPRNEEPASEGAATNSWSGQRLASSEPPSLLIEAATVDGAPHWPR